MSDLRDFTGKNRKFTGTDAETISSGTTAERVDGQAKLRFNTTTNLMEYYTGTEWKAIDAPPIITGFTVDGGADVTSATINNANSGDVTIEVKGSLFDTTNGNVTFVGTGETLSTSTITRNNSSLLTVTLPYSGFDNANEPYAIKVTNGSGLSATLESAISADQPVTFINAVDTNYGIFDSARASGTIAAADLCGATDADGDTITYSVSSGSLPSGCTLNTSTGAITYSSISAVGSDTTSTFTIQAATTDLTITRQFKITVKAPVTTSYTSTGAGTFSVPTGLTAIDVLVVAGGGGSAGGIPNSAPGAGGGAGGLIYVPGFPVTPGSSVPYSVGNGGAGQPGTGYGQDGQNSTFSTLTALGGGGGAGWPAQSGRAGGSGAGGSVSSAGGGPGQQPSQPGDSGTYGFGNPGGGADGYQNPGNPRSGGGGGAGGSGNTGPGGIGRAYSISGSPVYYAGGGSGGGQSSSGGQGGGGSSPSPTSPGTPGTANRGGGGGGGTVSQSDSGPTSGGSGGSGIIIVSY